MRSFGSNDIELTPQSLGKGLACIRRRHRATTPTPDAANGISITLTAMPQERRIVVGAMPGKIGQIAFTVFL